MKNTVQHNRSLKLVSAKLYSSAVLRNFVSNAVKIARKYTIFHLVLPEYLILDEVFSFTYVHAVL